MSKQETKEAEILPAVKEEAGLPAVMDFMNDAGMGFEDSGAGDYAIPFLRVLQSGSPQCKPSEAEYVKGAKEGDLFNTVTRKLYTNEDGGCLVIPCHYVHKYNEWAVNRGGFKGTHTAAEYAKLEKATVTDKKGKQYEGNAATGNILQDSREHYVIIVNPNGTLEPALFSLGSTQIKKSKRWMTFMDGLKLPNGRPKPMASQIYRITTVAESNDDGTWAGVKIDHVRELTADDMTSYVAAKDFNAMVRSGLVKVTPVEEEAGETETF